MKFSRPAAFLLVFLLAVPLDASGQDGAELIQATDLLEIRELDDVAVSPSGRRVAYTVTTVVELEDDEAKRPYAYRTHIYLVDVARGTPPRPLTRGKQSATSPAWHPDGDRLAFVREVEGESQVFVLPLAGGEPYQLTHAEHGAAVPAWSPDGTQLLYASVLPANALYEATGELPAWPGERPGRTRRDTVGGPAPAPNGSPAEVRAWLAQNADASSPKVLTRLDFQGERELRPTQSFRHLFVIDANTPQEQPDPVRITEGYYDYGGGAWLSNGRQIVFSGSTPEDRHPDRVRRRTLYVASADGTQFAELLAMDGYALYAPTPAPEGSAIAFLARPLDDPGFAQTELGLYDLFSDAPPRLLSLAFDRSVGAPQWSPNGWHLYTVAASNGGFPLYRLAPFARTGRPPADSLVPADSTALRAPLTAIDTIAAPVPAPMRTETPAVDIERLTSYTRGIRAFDVGPATAFYVATSVTNPYELYANTMDFAREQQLTRHNAAWLGGKQLATAEPFTVRRDSFEIQAWIMRPPFYEEGGTYPLLLEIHGGPMAMWGPGEATMWHEFQYLAAQGYAVVYANPRGSSGYGLAFKQANYRDWGAGPAGDVLAAASAAAQRPWVDAEQQVVTGGSYAGYLTAWIIGHTDRFDAAVAQRGVYDLTTFLGEGNAWRLVPWHFGGYPWETTPSTPALPADRPALLPRSTGVLTADSLAAPADTLSPRAVLVRNSPLTYVDQIHTPLLIIHADDDLRTGVSQSEMLYRSLKILERPVEYVRYPDAGHDLSRTGAPKQRLDRILRIYEFFERYVNHDAAVSAQR